MLRGMFQGMFRSAGLLTKGTLGYLAGYVARYVSTYVITGYVSERSNMLRFMNS